VDAIPASASGRIAMNVKPALVAAFAGLGLLAAGSASAATVTTALNVRAAPTPEADILGVVPAGTEVECAEMVGNWCELAGGEGYVYGAYLDFGDDADEDEDDGDEEDDDDLDDLDDLEEEDEDDEDDIDVEF
jgi:hypothetical protein